MKLCECGCGQPAPISQRTDARRGVVKGFPSRFVRGHQNRPGLTYEVRDCGHDTPCHVWTRGLIGSGYGTLSHEGEKLVAHRYAWEQTHGPVPAGAELDHLCRNRACVNPEHLEPVSHPTNAQRGASAKLDWDAVRVIRASSASHRELAERYGVTWHAIRRVRAGDRWKEATS